MVTIRSVPTDEEIRATYRILKGMAFRKQFRTEQDREDFIQDVMLSAVRSFKGALERHLSFKNLACGLAFKRAYQTYWRRFYGRSDGSRTIPPSVPSDSIGGECHLGLEEKRTGYPARPVAVLIRRGGWGLHEGDEQEKSWHAGSDSSAKVIEAIKDESSEEPEDLILRGMVQESIEQLESPYRGLIHCFLLGMTREEAAAKMQKSVPWAKKYTLLALDILIRRLKRQAILPETFELKHILK